MAKGLDKAPEQEPTKSPSALVMMALGEHAEQQGLVQGEGEAEIDFAVRCIERLGDLVVAMDRNIFVAEEEIAVLKRRLASQRGETTKAKARIVEIEEAARPRALGPMAALFDEDDDRDPAVELCIAIDSAADVVLAFSDGHSELRGIRPRQVRASAFRLTRGRVLFTDEPLEVTGPGEPGMTTTLAGVALLLDGEQAAWAPLAQPIAIGAGQTINLAGSVIFG